MAILSPSILSADFSRLEADCRRALEAGARMLHFDVMDGCFVPNISFGVPVLKSIHRAVPEAFWDVHLMISRPQDYVRAFAEAGASLINFHIESDCEPVQVLGAIRELGCQTGMTIKPATSPETLLPYLSQLDLVLVMSVEPGFGGQTFMPSALEKIRWLAQKRLELGLNYQIEVDGGIDAETGRLCTQAGADILVAGSSVFGAENISEACQALISL